MSKIEKIWSKNQNSLAGVDAKHLQLWKVDIPINDDKLNNADIDVEKELEGVEMFPADLISTHSNGQFPVSSMKNVHINIIVQAPVTRFSQEVRAQDAVNWHDIESIYNWIKTLKRSNEISSPKAYFIFIHGRDGTMETLFKGSEGMNGICQRFEKRRATDRNNHHIPILVNGPGAGKSRFLQELPTLLNSQARQYTNDDALLNSIENRMFTINVTFGNGTFASEEDVHIGQTSVALRIIYQHFIAGGSINYDQFLREYDKTSQIPISDALDIVLRDVNTNKDDDTKINFIVVGIDEINHLHNLYNKELDPRQNPVRLIVHAVGRLNCSGGDIFYVPILAGTIQGPLEEMFRESTYLYLRLPLRLLRDEEVWNISKNIANSNNLAEYINRSTFRRCISDLGGQVRALELFYSILSSQAMQKTNYVDYVYIMLQVKNLLLHRYPFETYANIITPAIAHAILNIPVKEYDKADNNGQLNYIYLSSQGMLNL
ncbi:24782_t:CDS:2 [Gigaspora rosea]|nr:24782_t:CDS:2 [Gigaspora rosea]